MRDDPRISSPISGGFTQPGCMENQWRRNVLGLPQGAAIGADLHSALHSLTYVSRAVERDPRVLIRQASEIAAASSVLNRRDGITGALSVGGGWFAQVMEGPIRALLATFDRLLRDRRHEDIRLIEFGPITARDFASWSMACSGTLPPDLVSGAAAAYAAREAARPDSTLDHGLALSRAMLAQTTQAAAALAGR